MNINMILLGTTVFFILLSPRQFRTIVNPGIIFSALWTFVVFLSSLQLLDMYSASNDVFLIIFCGVLAFLAGSMLARLSKNIKLKIPNYLKNGEVTIRYNLLIILVIICIVYYLPSFIRSILFMLKGLSINDVRSLIQDSEYSKGFNNFIPNFIILPIAISLEVIGIVDFWLAKRNKTFIVLTLILVLIRVLGDGGRTPIFNVLLYFIITFFIIQESKQRKYLSKLEKLSEKKVRKKFRRIATLGVFLLVILTFMRTASSIFRKIYFYFSMSPVLLTWWINEVNVEKYRGYGAVSFNGVLYFFDYFIHNISKIDYTPFVIDAYNWIAQTDSFWPKIAPTTTANAYVSCFWFFYADAGIIGVLVLSFLYGFVVSRYYFIIKKEKANLCTIAVYLLLFQGVCFSFIRFPFAKAYYIIALFFIRFIAFKKSLH